MVKKGDGPTRTVTHGHHSGSVGGTKIDPKKLQRTGGE
jgi:hypothetical protein